MIEPPREDELLVVVGPTASGKTALALALADALSGEIVGADSVQVYRRFDVGSGKPTTEELARAPHHLIDVADAKEPLDAAAFVELADRAIADVRARGRTPIVCGGTFLWVKALLHGLAEGAPRSDEIRARHKAEAEATGRAALHARLAEVDPPSAAKLGPNDLVRVSRALEVFELTGERMSDVQARHGFRAPRHQARLVGVRRDLEELKARIHARTVGFFARGLVDEVRALLDDGYGETRAMGSVGYAEAKEVVLGRLAEAEAVTAIDRATRVLVRRQSTWLRDEPVTWLTGV